MAAGWEGCDMGKEYSWPATKEGEAIVRKLLSDKFGMSRLVEVADEIGIDGVPVFSSANDLAGLIVQNVPSGKVSWLIATALGEGSIRPRKSRGSEEAERRLRQLCQLHEAETEPLDNSEETSTRGTEKAAPVPAEAEQAIGSSSLSQSTKEVEGLIRLIEDYLKVLGPKRNLFIDRGRLTEVDRLRRHGAKLVHKNAPWLISDWNRAARGPTEPNLVHIDVVGGSVSVAYLMREFEERLAILGALKEEIQKASEPEKQSVPRSGDSERAKGKAMSGAGLGAQAKDESVDVVIVCALHKPELEKVRVASKTKWERVAASRVDPSVYERTEYITKGGTTLRVVAGAPNQMGLSAAAVLATKMVMRFRPKIVAMVGIAAGASAEKQGYGNILAADTTFDYGAGKVVDNGGAIDFQPDPAPLSIDSRLRSLLKVWESGHSELSSIYQSWPARKPQTVLGLHVGPLGSGAAVIDDGGVVSDVKSHWRKLVGIEMEAYAVHRACTDTVSPAPVFLCLKSICDFAHQKNDGWQEYAAFTAAEFCFRFLGGEWESLFPDED
ncbi:hypothetical protein D7Y15_07535 [Corallococcus sp. AB030]|uniref:5'-methylthioadenosine/S-adenosylhomocysteine nucleosidase family protein n=1 Tax=Corallococcus sp. AB030 TaxID=2316716 RepID=UPI000EC7978C|nr:hypothetical protein [Corallococcus sp. AB030]RKI18684.1 hypothetical protein D7Y15_07535 [Corallococcus sp. AB030]